MAVYCRECRCVFSRSRINCPFCGNPPQNDLRTVQELTDSGFRLISDGRQSKTHASPGPAAQPSGQGFDALERLRQAYQVNHTQAQVHTASPSGSTEIPAEPSPPSQESGTDSLNDWLYGSAPDGYSSTVSESGPYRTAPQEPDLAPPPPPDRQHSTYKEQELRRLRRSQQAYNFRSRVSSFFNTIALLPWSWIFRILLAVAAILLIRAFILALPSILNGVLNLLLGLLPTMLAIGFIIWLLRNIFRP